MFRKLSLIIFIPFLFWIIGITRRYPWKLIFIALMERRRLAKFILKVHFGIIVADLGKGKTLATTVIANSLPKGVKKLIGYINDIDDAEIAQLSLLKMEEKLKEEMKTGLRVYIFFDEIENILSGVEIKKNREYNSDVPRWIQIIRHNKWHLWITATREHHVWVAMKQLANYLVYPSEGVEDLADFQDLGISIKLSTLTLNFKNQKEETVDTFKVLITELDFKRYKTAWLNFMLWFR